MNPAVNYLDCRRMIRSGDLLAFSHAPWWPWSSFKSQIVRMATRSAFSHVATAWRMGGRLWVIEAVQPRPRLVPLSALLPAYWLPMRAPFRPETLNLALSVIGRQRSSYSQDQAIKGFLGTLHPGEDDAWMCAELAWCLAKSDGIDLGAEITPAGLVEAAMIGGAPLNYLEMPWWEK